MNDHSLSNCQPLFIKTLCKSHILHRANLLNTENLYGDSEISLKNMPHYVVPYERSLMPFIKRTINYNSVKRGKGIQSLNVKQGKTYFPIYPLGYYFAPYTHAYGPAIDRDYKTPKL